MWPTQLQFLHLSWELVWNTTFESLLLEVSPCLLLHLLLRHKMTTFRSRTPPRVPMMGPLEGVSIDKVITLANWESMTSTPNPPPLLVFVVWQYGQVRF